MKTNLFAAALLLATAAAALASQPQPLLVAMCAPAVTGQFKTASYEINSDLVKLVVAHKDAETLQLAKRACMDVVEIGAQQDGFLFRAQEWTNTKRRAMDLVTGVFEIPHSEYVIVLTNKDDADFSAVKGERELLRPIRRMSKKLSARGPVKFVNDATKSEIINSLDIDEYFLIEQGITGVVPIPANGIEQTITTRYTLADGNDVAAQYMLEYFENLGYPEVFLQAFTQGGKRTHNIVAIKPGTTKPDEIVLVGAHMDSTSQSPSQNAPGCIDNGSGTAGTMTVAKAFANVTSARTIYFVLFSAEEQGLIGSEYFCEVATDEGLDIVAALTMDMIGYSNEFVGVIIEGTTNSDIMDLMDNFENNVFQYAPELTTSKAYYSYGSDHVSFQRAGYPSFLAIEQDNTDYPAYHTVNDKINYLSLQQSYGIIKGIAGSLWDYAESIQ